MRKTTIICAFLIVLLLIGCNPRFRKISVDATPSESGKGFIADCGEQIEITWEIENEGDIGSQEIAMIKHAFQTGLGYHQDRIPLEKDDRSFTFTFHNPVTVHMIVRKNEREGPTNSVMLDFGPKDYYFNAKFTLDNDFPGYPQLGDPDSTYISDGKKYANLYIDFNNFIGFYDVNIVQTIDYLKNVSQGLGSSNQEGPFKMRTWNPREEKRSQCGMEHIEDDWVCYQFEGKFGNNYPYYDSPKKANSIVYAGGFAKTGDELVVTTKKEDVVVTTRQAPNEIVNPIFLEVGLLDRGEWSTQGSSRPEIVGVMLGNTSQKLIVETHEDYVPALMGSSVSIGSVNTASVQNQSNNRGIISGELKGTAALMEVTLHEDNGGQTIPIPVGVEEAHWRIPYLRDTDNLESMCGD